MKKKKKDGFSLKKRIQYWFDNRIANGSLGLIRALIAASLVMAVLIAGLILLFGFEEDSEPAAVIWDSIATVINAWMPYWDEGSLGYLLLMSVTAIAGVLFTSVLIGIVTSAIEDKISDLRRGNSFVPEQDHIVVLGLPDGEFTLLRQLILAAAGDPVCIVLGEDLDREEMEHDLKENLDVPKNVRIITRTVDITDPASIEKCSVETCRTVIVSPMDDTRTVKAVSGMFSIALLQVPNCLLSSTLMQKATRITVTFPLLPTVARWLSQPTASISLFQRVAARLLSMRPTMCPWRMAGST